VSSIAYTLIIESRLTYCSAAFKSINTSILEASMSAAQTVALTRGNSVAELPLLAPTLGPAMIDTRRLREETGYWAYDPAFGETGACRSAITYVDGDEGVLLYRGYPIDQLVERCDFLEVCWLLLNGNLPNATQKAKFTDDITHHTMVN